MVLILNVCHLVEISVDGFHTDTHSFMFVSCVRVDEKQYNSSVDMAENVPVCRDLVGDHTKPWLFLSFNLATA